MYLIQNVYGKYYNEANDSFGPLAAATEYVDFDDLPEIIAGVDEDLELEIFAEDDARYYAEDAEDAEAAVVYY